MAGWLSQTTGGGTDTRVTAPAHLAQVLDPTDVQTIFAFQLNQFIACCNVAAVQAPFSDVPCIVLAVMQSDCESLFLQGSHRVITFPTLQDFYFHPRSVILFERNDCSELHT